MESCQLEDLGYKGYPFTWTNKRPGDANTKLRLDRAIAMKGWIENFQASNVVHLLPHASDHIPIAIHFQKFRQKHCKADRGFKFKEVGRYGMNVRHGFSKRGAWQVVGNHIWQLCMQK